MEGRIVRIVVSILSPPRIPPPSKPPPPLPGPPITPALLKPPVPLVEPVVPFPRLPPTLTQRFPLYLQNNNKKYNPQTLVKTIIAIITVIREKEIFFLIEIQMCSHSPPHSLANCTFIVSMAYDTIKILRSSFFPPFLQQKPSYSRKRLVRRAFLNMTQYFTHTGGGGGIVFP